VTGPEPAATLYDVRYSRYEGTREPRWRAVLAIARSSAGRALGLRRGTGAKVWPFLLVVAAYLPVAAVVGVPLLLGQDVAPQTLLSYEQLLAVLLLVVIAFAATTLPSLLTRERRDRVLSLYFSTAVSPVEYLAGKVLAAVGLMALVSLGPLLALLVGGVLTASSPLEQLREDGGDLLPVLAAGIVVAVVYAAMGLTAGSLTDRRVFAVGGLLGVLLVTPVLSRLLYSVTGRDAVLALDLAGAPAATAALLLPGAVANPEPPPPGATVAVCAALVVIAAVVLVVRHRGEQR
jgi:ABC-2 type transport system permease protein